MIKLAHSRKSGFTLIEILVVIAIIGVLAYFLVPRLLGTQDMAKEAAVKAIMHQLQISLESFNIENETYPVATSVGIKNLCENYLMPPNYIGAIPKNPYTGKAYTDDDVAGKIIYNFDNNSGKYTLTGYNRFGTHKILILSNIDE